MKILLIFTLCLISDGGASNEVTGYSGGDVLIKCKYKTLYTQRPKYFCKGSRTSCSDQIKTDVKNQWVNSGRFSLFDDTKSSEFWVMIRELTVHDTETYHCRVDLPWGTDIYTPVVLNVIKGPSESREVRAFVKGGINIKCRYENKYIDKPKSFCKIRAHQWCFKQTAHKTDLNSEWSHDGRFSIQNNRSAGFFSVFIRELTTWDTGTYACGVVVSDKIEVYTVVELSVTEDQFYEKSIRETAHVGEDLTLRFKYPDSLKSNPKFLCRMKTPDSLCFYKDSVKESRKSINIGKFVLYDDRAKQHFNVSISSVTEQNSGEYWCGAEVNWTSDHGYKVYFTDINLRVTAQRVSVSPSKPAQTSLLTSSSLSRSSLSSSSSSSSLLSSSSLPLLLTNELQLTPASPAAEFSVSTVITVSVILLLLLFGSIFVVVTLQKKHKMQGTASTGRGLVHGPGNNQEVPLDVCEYEEIKDTRRLSASDTGTSTIYSTAQLPKLPSDHHTVYSNTSPCDSAVYSTIQDIYTKAQLPAQLSAGKSAESLNYATVSFPSKAIN